MSHIVIDARELRTSTGRYIERLIHYLQQIDHGNDYTILLYPKDMDGWEPTNPRFTKVACPHKEFTFDEQLGFLNQLKGLNADLVHFAAAQQPILYFGKTVTTMHDLTTARFYNPSKNRIIFTLKQQVYKGVINAVARKSEVIFTPSEYVKNDIAAFTYIQPDKITVTYESADAITDAARPIETLVGKQFIMYLGRPQPHKNLNRLLDTFELLKQHHKDLHLVLAGKKDVLYTKYEQTVFQRGIPDVVFTDFVSEGQLRWLYENCAAYVFPSLSEGFGLPGLEAMRSGAPVVSSNATCLPEIYGSAARYFDPLDIQDMASKIQEVLSDETVRSQLVHAGFAQAEKYSWKRMAVQTLAAYEWVLSS